MLLFLVTGNQLIICKEMFIRHMFNMECCTLILHDRVSLKSFRGNSGKKKVILYFSEADYQKRGLSFSWVQGHDLHRNYVMVVILFSLLFTYENLILNLNYIGKTQLP